MSTKTGVVPLRLVLMLFTQKTIRCPASMLYPTVLSLREDWPLWLPRPATKRVSVELEQALEGSEAVMSWVYSDNWMRSPQGWPPEVAATFRWRLIPSPVELGSIKMHGQGQRRSSLRETTAHSVLLAYCYGFPVAQIAFGLGISERMVLVYMIQAVRYLAYRVPAFCVWATATDYAQSNLPCSMYAPLGGKERAVPILQENPFQLARGSLDHWVASTRIMTQLIYHTAKKPRLATQDREFYLAEAPDVSSP